MNYEKTGSLLFCAKFTIRFMKGVINMSNFSKICYGSYEREYQEKHKKVKDRYSSNKFYANNFKKNRKKK